MQSPYGMGQIDFNDPYGYGMGAIEQAVQATSPSDPIPYIASKTSFTIAQLNQMAMNDPDELNRLLFKVQSGSLYNVMASEFENAVAQESAWGSVLDEMNKAATKAHADVMAYQYAKLGSRYTVGQASQEQQNALVISEQSKQTMMKAATFGALGIAAFILLR